MRTAHSTGTFPLFCEGGGPMGQLGYLLPSRRLFRMCCRGEESESERDNTLQHRKQMIIVFSHCVFFTAFLCFPLCFYLFIYNTLHFFFRSPVLLFIFLSSFGILCLPPRNRIPYVQKVSFLRFLSSAPLLIASTFLFVSWLFAHEFFVTLASALFSFGFQQCIDLFLSTRLASANTRGEVPVFHIHQFRDF